MSVLQSRRLWTFILAQVVSGATLIIGHQFADPFALQVGTLIVSTVEGVAGILIVAYTVDDVHAKRITTQADRDIQLAAVQMGTHPDYYPLAVIPDQSGKVAGE